MRKITPVFFAVFLLFGCGSKELSRQKAFDIIKKEMGFPKPVEYDVFCGDPKHAANALKAGLEEKGLVTVQRTVKLKDVGKEPIIQFTNAAQPYLLPTPADDRKYKIQKVKIADKEIAEITGIRMIGDNYAIVKYSVQYKNVTPFAALMPGRNYNGLDTMKAEFALYDDGWKLERAKKH